jgi:hypothetical protein
MVRKWGELIIRSRQYASGLALVVAFFSFFDLPIGWLSTVIIALITLQNGPVEGLMVTAWAILPAVAMLWLGQYTLFLNILILHYLIVWVFAVVLRKHTWVNVLQLSALLGMTAIILIHYFIPEVQSWLVNQITSAVKDKTITIFSYKLANIDVWMKYIGSFAVGLMALMINLANLMTLFLARWWQSNIVSVISIQKECYTIRMHYVVSLSLVILAMGLYVDSILFLNVFILALVPFIFSGLSLLHMFAATKKNGSIIMVIFYLLFLFLSPYIALLLTFMGWLDSFFNFRKKIVLND